jgi:hypothetical protein
VHDANCELRIGDVSRASSKIKGELPGRGTEVKKDAEKWGAEAGAKFDSAVRIALTSSLDHGLQGYCIPLIRSSLPSTRSSKAPTNHLPQAEKAKQEVANAENKLEQYRKEAGQKIDAADRKVEDGANKAKSGISSWFGGGK